MVSELVKSHHLDRRAVVYVRQSTPHQVLSNQESLRLQYDLRQRACDLGWREADIEVVDADLGLSGASAAHRQGFKDLVARIALGEVGLIVSIEVTRLARNCSDWCWPVPACTTRRSHRCWPPKGIARPGWRRACCRARRKPSAYGTGSRWCGAAPAGHTCRAG